MKISLPQIKGSKVLTGSRIQCFQTCPRKHHYQYNLGIRREKIAHYFRTGSAGHLGIELRAKGAPVFDAIIGAVASYEAYPHWAKTPEQRHEWDCEREVVVRLLNGYFWYWERPNIPAEIDIAQWLECESSFQMLIVNPETGRSSQKFQKAGKCDGVVMTKANRTALIEHKFVSDDISPESDYWTRLRIDNQISGYYVAKTDQGVQLDEVLFNVIRKPTMRASQVPVLDENNLKIVIDTATGERMLKSNIKKDGTPGAGHGEPYQSGNAEKGWVLQTRPETPEEFGERLSKDIEARPEHYYQRRVIPRLENDLQEYRKQLWEITAAINASNKNGTHFRNTAACTNMGTCQYLPFCSTGFDPNQLPEGFVRVEDLHEELD